MDKLEPEDIRLSEAMALSAASLSPHLGLVGDTSQVKHLGTDLMIIVGAAMAKLKRNRYTLESLILSVMVQPGSLVNVCRWQ